jgi:serine O-acetyltransferase
MAHEPALVAITHYRLGHDGRRLLRLIHAVAALPVRLLTGVEIPVSTQIGSAFRIAHYGGTIINGGSVIGDRCTLEQGVLLGGTESGAPTLGDDVWIGSRAVLIGAVTIGERATVGAGAVVTKDVPEDHVAVGNPAATRPRTHPGAKHRF